MSFKDILNGLLPLLPELGAIVGHPELAPLIKLLEDEVQRRMQDMGQSRAEVLADAAATYAQFRKENADLKALGHEQP